jgi:hypothetical protein
MIGPQPRSDVDVWVRAAKISGMPLPVVGPSEAGE